MISGVSLQRWPEQRGGQVAISASPLKVLSMVGLGVLTPALPMSQTGTVGTEGRPSDSLRTWGHVSPAGGETWMYDRTAPSGPEMGGTWPSLGLQLSQGIMCPLSSGAAAVGAGRRQPGAPSRASSASSCRLGLEAGLGHGLGSACAARPGAQVSGQDCLCQRTGDTCSAPDFELSPLYILARPGLTTAWQVGIVPLYR